MIRMIYRNILAALSVLVFGHSSMAQAPALIWQKCIGGSGYDIAYSMEPTSDSGYVVAGSTTSINGDFNINFGSYDVFITKLDKAGDIVWKKTYGSGESDQAFVVKQTVDGGYIVLANTAAREETGQGDVAQLPRGLIDLWILKLDGNGDIQWQKTIGGSNYDYGFSSGNTSDLKQTSDSGFIIASYSFSKNGDLAGNVNTGMEVDAWGLKLDKFGNIQWSKLYGGSGGDRFQSVQPLADGGFLFAGSSASNDYMLNSIKTYKQQNAWLVRTNAAGNVLWQKTHGGTDGYENIFSIQATTDGGFVTAGFSSSTNGSLAGVPNKGNFDSWLVKLDSGANIQWQKKFGGSKNDISMAVRQTKDGGYVVASYAGDITGQNADNGTLTYPVGGGDGDITNFHGGAADIWLYKTTASGNLEWQRAIGGSGSEIMVLSQYSPTGLLDKEGNYIIVGGTNSNNGDVSGNKGSYDAWVAKFSPCENLPSAVPVINANANVLSTSSGYTSYQWLSDNELINGAATASYTAAATAIYTVIVTNQYGCADTSAGYQYYASPNIFVPNVFTPNGDGKNDLLKVYGNQIASVDFQIFNQWGQRIFISKDVQQGWNGQAGGKPQPVGVYVYVLKATLLDGNIINKKGSINLIR